MPPPLLVFTDLDGTLLSHDNYSASAAQPALAALRRIGAGVVMASSKTAPEMLMLRDKLGLGDWPAIVENGAGLLPPGGQDTGGGDDYRALRSILDNMPAHLRAGFRGFGDMSTSDVAEITGLPPDDAARAAKRRFSEPGLWTGSDADRGAFLQVLATHKVQAREGGRFLTLSFGQTKADHMAKIIAQYQPRFTVALGDAPNDIEMLQAADFGIIVANPHRDPLPQLKGETSGHITRTELPGPRGWNIAIMKLIARLALE